MWAEGRRQRWGAGRTLDRGLLSPALGGKAKEGGGLGLVAQLSPRCFPQVMELPERVGERWRKFQNRLIPVRLQARLLLAPSSPLLRPQNLCVRPQINLKIELQLDELMSTSKFTGA